MEAEVVVRGGHVLTMGPAGTITDGAVAIGGGGIVAVGPAAEVLAAHPAAPVVGGDEGIVTPGFVNAHTHLSEALVPGMGEDMTLFEWGARVVGRAGMHITREMARVGTRLKAAEMLLSGVTTVNDMFCHTNMGTFASLGAIDGLEDIGLRGVVSFGAEDVLDPHPVAAFLEEHEALADHAAGARLVGYRMGVGTVLGQTDPLLEASVDLARRRGWSVHTHLAEVREEVVQARLRWSRDTVERALDVGLLDVPVIAGHCIWVGRVDVGILADRGVAAAHNPVANMILASGVCPVGELQGAGIPVGIGTDGAASNDSQNMLEAIKAAALLQKVHRLDPRALTAPEALRMATIEGARALGLDDRIGSLEVGKRADLVRFHGRGIGLATVHDPCQQLVYCASPADVSDVWVDGRALVRDGALAEVRLSDLVAGSRPLADELVTRAGMQDLSCRARPS
ncbi:MAG: amidohydrolase family protein [Chloroflexi bacterium]|jgi:cytosine/adenosine deaminase-related metal-dependent hydrolase|nr:amidohydrolase family protein [Chloroflexota bacterium]